MTKGIPVLNAKQVMATFPARPHDSHKGLFGKAVIIGGASGMVGAAFLAGRAALKLGAGCVHIGLLAENVPLFDPFQPELMLHPASVAIHLTEIDALAIGCGLGLDQEAQALLDVALKSKATLVLDADALNILASHPELRIILSTRHAATILTPHPGEASRLLACDTGAVQADRVGAIRAIAQKFSCGVVLKGANSLCLTSDGHLYQNQTGNPGMSTAGMGDVLTGMIAAFIAQRMSADDAMLLAVYLHGVAGDALSAQDITVGMTASDLTEWARWKLNQLTKPETS